MDDEFLYLTVRAEWHVNVFHSFERGKKGKLTHTYGPFASKVRAEEVKAEMLSQLSAANTIDVDYQEKVVDIDPILELVVKTIGDKIKNWFDLTVIQKKKNRRNPLYLHESAVRRSFAQLADQVSNETFAKNKENEYASSETSRHG